MKRFFLILLCFGVVVNSISQTLEENLSRYNQENAALYVQPFVDAFSASFNSGLFHNARIKKGLKLYFGVVGQVAVVPSKARFFQVQTGSYPSNEPIIAPTVFGPKEEKNVEIPTENGYVQYALPGGFDLNYMPMAIPQVTVGSIYGTDFMGRYFALDVEDYGRFQVLGWGIRHSIDQYFTWFPIDIAAGYYHQNFKVEDYMDASLNVVNLQMSFSIPVLTFYGGIGYENSEVTVDYVYRGRNDSDNGESVVLNMNAVNSVRFTTGITLNLGPIKINGDYNFADQSTFVVGMGIGIND